MPVHPQAEPPAEGQAGLQALNPAELAQWREAYRQGKTQLLATALNGASTRGVRRLLKHLARHADQLL